MERKDYYKILGINRSANPEEIRRAYLKKAHDYHPDKTCSEKKSEDKFKEMSEAYEVLKNKERKEKYDSLWSKRNNQRFDRSGNEDFFGDVSGHSYYRGNSGRDIWEDKFDSFSDFFKSMFSDFFDRPSEPRNYGGNHIHYDDLIR
jgi:DnaJ-class molecular chaperone